MSKPKGLLGVNVLYWRKNLRHCWEFLAPLSDSAPPMIRGSGHCVPSLLPWSDTSQQSAQLWNLQSPECWTTSPNSEITTTLVRQCIQNAHERLVRQVLLANFMGKQPRGRPKPRWRVCTSDLAWFRLDVEPAKLSEIAVDREVFWVLQGLVPLRPP